jgi:hypothetical protein
LDNRILSGFREIVGLYLSTDALILEVGKCNLDPWRQLGFAFNELLFFRWTLTDTESDRGNLYHSTNLDGIPSMSDLMEQASVLDQAEEHLRGAKNTNWSFETRQIQNVQKQGQLEGRLQQIEQEP